MRFCSYWQIYADDITVRSGRWLDGAYYSDEEKSARVKYAVQREKESRPSLESAFRALGFDPTPLGQEKDGKAVKPKKRAKTKGEQAESSLTKESAGCRSPYAQTMVAVFLVGQYAEVSVGESVIVGAFVVICSLLVWRGYSPSPLTDALWPANV